MDHEHPVKAEIRNVDDKSEPAIECLFNPKEYTFTKRNTWNPGKEKGENVPLLEFGGGESMTLQMQLFFDTYTTGKDVTEITKRIWKLMNISERYRDKNNTKGRPPLVEFRWGKVWSFKAVIQNISQNFTLFRHDGTPVRATMDVTFVQALEEGRFPFQNPTTMGLPGYRRRVVKEGDTIDWIAFDENGDSAMWRFIAETKNLDDPRRLRPGQILAVAPAR
jgi:hypothetical protein